MYALLASDVGMLLVKPLYKREKTVIKAKKKPAMKSRHAIFSKKKKSTAIEKKKQNVKKKKQRDYKHNDD